MGGNNSKNDKFGVWVSEEKNGETRIMRNPRCAEENIFNIQLEIDTIWKGFENSVKKFSDRPCLGSRIKNKSYFEFK
jgi:hypothetical protein